MKQIFAESLNDEKLLLSELLNDFANKEIYISFNGNQFDIPYLNARYFSNEIYFKLTKIKSFDIYPYFKDNRSLFKLPNAKLKTIEKYFDISREDSIDGRESVELYYQYLKNKDKFLLDKILLHNKEDIINLLHLFSKSLLLDKKLQNYGPKVIHLENQAIYITHTSHDDFLLSLSLSGDSSMPTYHQLETNFKIDTLSKNKFIQLPILIFYKDYDEYIFIDTNKLLMKDFDQLSFQEKSDYLISHNDCYDLDILEKIVNMKIDIL